MTVVLALAAVVCLLLALGGWYDLRHRASGDRRHVDGRRRARRAHLEVHHGRASTSRAWDLDWF
ncbi:hypothetical protein ASG49_05025 [Marmoricola sp. Leaf446]|uniref:hypothetical protein n=1 Tax=Marmoricola sp. Leaf446 TaxID=1736379 RepID=UPI0006FBCF90|nr:hypothetical protein [Marmoricola sp. Leaf446]KQT94261.1 hypothetical protein ASG49_05025 [Marmoricola sp. Leaf446]